MREDAFDRALKVAQKEFQLAELRKLGTEGDFYTKQAEQELSRLRAELEDDPGVLRLLPAAQSYVRARERRYAALVGLRLGRLENALRNLSLVLGERGSVETVDLNGEDPDFEMHWRFFRSAVDRKNLRAAMGLLAYLNLMALAEIAEMRLPPIPQKPGIQ